MPIKTNTRQDRPQVIASYIIPQGALVNDDDGNTCEEISRHGQFHVLVDPGPNKEHQFEQTDGQGRLPEKNGTDTLKLILAPRVEHKTGATLTFRREQGSTTYYELVAYKLDEQGASRVMVSRARR